MKRVKKRGKKRFACFACNRYIQKKGKERERNQIKEVTIKEESNWIDGVKLVKTVKVINDHHRLAQNELVLID